MSRICDISHAADHIIRFSGLLPPFLHTASDQNWRYRTPGNEATIIFHDIASSSDNNLKIRDFLAGIKLIKFDTMSLQTIVYLCKLLS